MVFMALFKFRSAAITLAPCLAKIRHTSLPMPLPAPVIEINSILVETVYRKYLLTIFFFFFFFDAYLLQRLLCRLPFSLFNRKKTGTKLNR